MCEQEQRSNPLSPNEVRPLLPPETSALPSVKNCFGRKATNKHGCCPPAQQWLQCRVQQQDRTATTQTQKAYSPAYFSTQNIISRNSYLIKQNKMPKGQIPSYYTRYTIKNLEIGTPNQKECGKKARALGGRKAASSQHDRRDGRQKGKLKVKSAVSPVSYSNIFQDT